MENKKVIQCKYHEEKTPSLVIEGDKFYCLSCGAKGWVEQKTSKIQILHRDKDAETETNTSATA